VWGWAGAGLGFVVCVCVCVCVCVFLFVFAGWGWFAWLGWAGAVAVAAWAGGRPLPPWMFINRVTLLAVMAQLVSKWRALHIHQAGPKKCLVLRLGP